MKYDLKVSAEFVMRCNRLEADFAFDIAESFYDGEIHHDSNYRARHHQAFGDLVDVYLEYKGKVPEPLFSDVFNRLQETITTDCGW